MASGRTTRAGMPNLSGMAQRFEESPGGSTNSDDEEEGGTPLTETLAAAPRRIDDTGTRIPRHGDDTEAALRRHRLAPKSLLKANRILDWILGRRDYSVPQGLTDNLESGIWEQKQGVNDDDHFDIGDLQDLCPACTTSYYQAVDSIPFQSTLKLTYNDPMSQKWLIGNKYVLHEAIDDHPEDEYVPLVEAARALKTLAPEVPVPKVRAGWKENGKVITILDTVRGERLYDIWWDLSGEEREHVAKQVAGHIESWRKTDLGRISGLTSGPVYHHDNLLGVTEEGFGPFGSDLDLWQSIEARLEGKRIDEDTAQLLRDYMPPSLPCVFTHGDLSSVNIIVHQGEVVAITGFENAASLPAWAEHVALHFCCCAEDEQWKALLSKHTRGYRAALDWWSLWTAVEDGDLDSDDARLESLKARCRRWRGRAEILDRPSWSAWPSHEGGDLVRRVPGPDRLRYEDLLSDTSWECSTDDEQGHGSEDDGAGAGRKRGLTPYQRMQRRCRTVLASANGSLRHALGESPDKRRHHAPIAARDPSDTDSETDAESTPSRPQSSARPGSSAGLQLKSKGLRPLSLPSFALSERARDQLRSAGASLTSPDTAALQSIREDAPGEKPPNRASQEKRTSLFGDRAKPGSLYAALSAASTEARPRRHARSRSEERVFSGGVPADASRVRPRSMMQPSALAFRHDRGRVGGEDGDNG
ncbi:hypothetical protein EKO27_g2120 [Xylaria grammica]|uniref:Aminoglycoside phosphotransferase domain-containing protein n=1 Tax=Xylaria grammica TaxID=363999 RepID=A0A439DF21_9PEZI|nr:hypothetical protein EKO27_g2120 [Xylaria grammica]